ncbi:hypothetical protein PsYK624_070810 [Phanerochaete sordida]|uniref:F-box domain-containing protein n=1 Tax=Phanerochaete sordida TaxID=48140 RepID=A0A9P3GBR2_9APHY|nr:hypothetical protein PsYK624_070810 [Phanerochaete sordida]
MQGFITRCEWDIIWYVRTRLALCLMPPMPPPAQVMLEREFRKLRAPRSSIFFGIPAVFESSSEVDGVLAKLEEAHRGLREARNAFVPVSRVPVEVLSTIFEYLLGPGLDTFLVPQTKNLRAVSQVCRHWRAVAVNCPLLWRWPQVVAVHPEWTRLMLSRSQKTTIYLHAKVYASSASAHVLDACRLVLMQIHRLGEIHLSGDSFSIGTLLNFTSCAAPQLRSLNVSNEGWKADADMPTLGQSFLQGGAPALERLELHKCAVPWNAPLLLSCPKLQRLVVDGLESNRAPHPRFLAILANMPHLRVLHMDNVLPVSQALPDGTNAMPLPELQELHLSGPTSDISALLARVTFPTSTALWLRCTCSDQPEELTQLTAQLGARLTAARSAFPTRALHISLDAVQITVHAGAALAEDEAHWDVPARGALFVTLVAGTDTLHTPRAVETLLGAFALADVRMLLLDDYEGFLGTPFVAALLRKIPRLRVVHARHDAAAPVVAALTDDALQPCTDGLLIEDLEALVFEEVDMHWAFNDAMPFVETLQEAQLLRCLRSAPVDELRIKRCMNIGAGDVNTLCHLFTEVRWDAFEAYVTDADSEPGADDAWPNENVWSDYWEYEGIGIGWHS